MQRFFHYFSSFFRNTPIAIALLFLAVFSYAPYAQAGYEEYLPGSVVTIGEFVFDDDFVATTTADCTVTVYDPAGTLVVNAAPMTASANSWYAYSFTPAETLGTWPTFMTCGSALNGSLIRADKTFQITNNIVSSSSVATLVNTNTNTVVATASSSLSATLPNSIWSFSGRTLTSFGTLVADIWASGTRTLTSGTAIAADIWGAATRTLTGAGLTSGSLATLSDVQTATSSLNSAIVSSQGAINANTDTRVGIATSSLAAVINANTDATVLTASTSLGFSLSSIASSITALPAAVWNVATSTMTTIGSIGKVLATNIDVPISTVGGGSLTVADIWSYGTRTLTGAGLTSGSLATLSDVQTASSSVAAVVNANTDSRVGVASSSLASVINANTNSQVLTASTSLGLSLSSISSSITALPAAVWNVATTTMTTPGTIGYVLANNIDLAISAVSGGGGGLTAADVWAFGTRSLTSAALTSGSLATNADINTATSTLTTTITTASSSVASVVNANTNSATAGVTSAVNTNTDATVLAASSSLATSIPVNVWNATTRSLTTFGTLVSDIWSAGSRTLTGFGTLAADVWTNSTRTLTGAGLTSGSLATLSDVQTATSSLGSAITNSQTAINANTDTRIGIATSSLASVVNANTNTAVLTASTSLGSAITNSQTAINTNTDTRVGIASSSIASVVNANTDSTVAVATSSLASVINSNTTNVVQTATSSLAAVINANTNATVLTASTSLGSTLSSIASSITSIPANVWAAGTRTLTGFGTLAADVWTNSTRTLTGAGLTSGSLATLSDVQTATSSLGAAITNSQTAINANTDTRIGIATSSLASVVNANTNTAVLTASTSLGASISALPAAVWNVATSTMTTVGSIGRVLATNIDTVLSTIGGGSLTVADIWSYGTRSLTSAALNSGTLATNVDINSATSSVNTTISTASSSLAAVVNANTNATVLTASTSLGSSITSGFASVPANVWAYSSRTLTAFGTLATDVWSAATRTLTGAGLTSGSLATLSDVQNATSSLASAIATKATLVNQEAGWTVRQSDFGSVLAGSTFRTKVTVLNYQSAPTSPFATPTVTVYDSSRNVVVSGVAMTALSTGVYEYTYSVASLAAQGQWEAVVSTQVESGKTITTNDYFEVAGSPAQVLIQSMGSLATPNITANVRITNEGFADYEYQYEWCVVSDINNPCGGGNDTYYASAAKLIASGDDFDTVLSATVPTEGIYYFKLVVYFGSESSGASRQFTTSLYTPPPSGGGGAGGGGGSGGSPTPKPKDDGSCGIADINCDKKVSAVDFSIMLAYWKTTAPFANPRVDLNADRKVDAVDFSILLYHWGKRY